MGEAKGVSKIVGEEPYRRLDRTPPPVRSGDSPASRRAFEHDLYPTRPLMSQTANGKTTSSFPPRTVVNAVVRGEVQGFEWVLVSGEYSWRHGWFEDLPLDFKLTPLIQKGAVYIPRGLAEDIIKAERFPV